MENLDRLKNYSQNNIESTKSHLKNKTVSSKKKKLLVGGIFVLFLGTLLVSVSYYSYQNREQLTEKYLSGWADKYYGGDPQVKPEFRRFTASKEEFFAAVKNNYRGRTIKPFIYVLKEYTKEGKMDNYWRAAKKYGVNVFTVMGTNPYLVNLKSCPDEEIMMLKCEGGGVLHMVKPGESLASIANLYGVSNDYIRQHNFLKLTERVQPGQVYVVPKASPRVFTKELAAKIERRRIFRTPCSGSLGRYFGYCMHPIKRKVTFHKGMDIGAPTGTPIYSAAGGVVVKAGWAGGYGKLVVIKHTNGYKTYYGHMSRFHVHRGQKVKQRRIIGRVGSTGASTSPHLHFEIRKKGVDKKQPQVYKPVDPLKYIW